MSKMLWRLAANAERVGCTPRNGGALVPWKVSWELHQGCTRVAMAGVDHRNQFCMLPAAGTTWTAGSASAVEIADAGAKLFLMLGVPEWSRDSVPDQRSVSSRMAERLVAGGAFDATTRGLEAR
jgi:hypothetical protein